MSAFIVQDRIINTIVTFFAMYREGAWYRRKLRKMGYNLDTYEGKRQLGKDMFALNVSAVTQRYNGGAEGFRPLNYQYLLQPHYTRQSVVKAFACWLYQCSEGNCPESPLFELLDSFKGDVAYDIVRDTAEYDKALWG